MVYVPEGAFEWLLHEVGHYVAATETERQQCNYGLPEDESLAADSGSLLHGCCVEREQQAWAFESAVFGRQAMALASPGYRGGVGYRPGGIPHAATHHADRQIAALRLDMTRWRALAAEWMKWGRNRGPARAPWESAN